MFDWPNIGLVLAGIYILAGVNTFMLLGALMHVELKGRETKTHVASVVAASVFWPIIAIYFVFEGVRCEK